MNGIIEIFSRNSFITTEALEIYRLLEGTSQYCTISALDYYLMSCYFTHKIDWSVLDSETANTFVHALIMMFHVNEQTRIAITGTDDKYFSDSLTEQDKSIIKQILVCEEYPRTATESVF